MFKTLLFIAFLVVHAESMKSIFASFGGQTKNLGDRIVGPLPSPPLSPLSERKRGENEAFLKRENERLRDEFHAMDGGMQQLRAESQHNKEQIEKMHIEARVKQTASDLARDDLQAAEQKIRDRDERIVSLQDESQKNERDRKAQIESLKYQNAESQSLEKKFRDQQSLLHHMQTEPGLFTSKDNVRIVFPEWFALIVIGSTGIFLICILVILYQCMCRKKTKPKNLDKKLSEEQQGSKVKVATVSIVIPPLMSETQNTDMEEALQNNFYDEEVYGPVPGCTVNRLTQMI